MFCPNCGKELPENASFCTSCGTAVNAAPAPQPAMVAQPVMNSQPDMNAQPMINSQPDMNAQPMMNQAPVMNGQPMMNQAPVMNGQPMMSQAPVNPYMGNAMPNMGAPMQIVPAGKNIRFRCEACKNVSDVQTDTACPKCGAPAVPGGYLKMYRMGSAYGVAMPFGIYIDNEPWGYIGNKQTCWIRIPYGTHRIHVAAAANRRCTDMMITLVPEHPVEAVRVQMKPGFWTNSFVISQATPSELPD